MKDAGIEFKDTRYAYDDTWPKTSEMLQQQEITRTGKVPALQYNGTSLTQSCSVFPSDNRTLLITRSIFQSCATYLVSLAVTTERQLWRST